MASVVLTGDTSGQVTLSAPAIAGTNTITLPAATGTAALTSDSIGMVLLGTLTTTSGSTQTLSGLTLTGYKALYISINNVSFSTTANIQLASIALAGGTTVNTNSFWGTVLIDLSNGSFAAPLIAAVTTSGTVSAVSNLGGGGNVGITTSSTSLVFSGSAGNFDAGTITVYGMK